MQNLDPKDRPKMIGIAVALGVVVLIGVKATVDTVNGINPPANASTPSPSPTPAVAGVSGASGGTPTVTATEGDTAANGPFSLDRFPFVARGGRDPFAPVPDDQLASASVRIPGLETQAPSNPAPSTPVAVPLPAGPGARRTLGEVSITRGPGIGGEFAGTGARPAPPKPVVRVLPPAPPPYNVIGVVISEPDGRDVAILQRATGTDKKFVVVGDPLEGGYTVTGIESAGVRVKHPGHKPVTAPIPGVAPSQMPGSTEYFLPRQTIVVPATSMTMPLGETSVPGAAGTPGAPGTPVAQNPMPRAK